MDAEKLCTSRRGFLKGLAVGAGGIALGSVLIHPDEAVGQMYEDYMAKAPMEARWNLASGGMIFFSMSYFKTLYDQGGKEKLSEFFKAQGQRAEAGYKGLADRFGFIGNDAKSAAAILPALVAFNFGSQQKFEIEEATTEKAKVKCTNCAFWNMVKAMKINDDLCSDWSRYSWQGWAKGINPKLTSTLVKARPLGDSACEWLFELRA